MLGITTDCILKLTKKVNPVKAIVHPCGPLESMHPALHFRVIHQRNGMVSMEISFFDSVPGPDLAHTA